MPLVEIYDEPKTLKEYRCKKCRKLLFKYKECGLLRVEIKCDRCETINVIE